MKHFVVIDTNVVLSALQSKNGKSFGLISKIGSGLFDFAISVPLILEYEAILKNHLDRNIFSDSDAGAETIVTFNKKDFLEAETLGIKIKTPKEFLEEMEV